MNLKKIVLAISFLATFALVGTFSRPAHAANLTCTVSNVAWATVGTGSVQVYCNNAWYYGMSSTADGCTGKGLDAVKAWQNLAEAALLSGKKLYIEYTSGTSCMIYARLTNQ